MKNIILKLILSIIFLCSYVIVGAQTYDQQDEDINIEDIIYVKISDGHNIIILNKEFENKNFRIECADKKIRQKVLSMLTSQLANLYSLNRLQELKDKRIFIRIWVNIKAEVEKIEYVFTLRNGFFMSPEELYRMEKEIQNTPLSYDIYSSDKHSCEGAIFGIGINFGYLLQLKEL
ncbi:MAG: hypothetical protein LBG19_12525 [Prevotellaceae bacterium]|jgi:hypothetical protein|nr:hypothetical protein [Prevotellaceae bacterium]